VPDATARRTRTLAAALEPVVGQVYFSPECHDAYARLGFAASPGMLGAVALPDGPAYFTSRGSLLGQVQPAVIAAAFGVFKPAVVKAGAQHGWSLTDAPTIFAARRAGAVAQLERVLGPAGDEVGRTVGLLERAVTPLGVEGRPLYAGLESWWDDPSDGWTRLFHLGDMLRECRGDAHIAAWSSAALDGVEIGLLNDLYMGLPLKSSVRTRGWTDDELDAGESRLVERGWLADGALTAAGRDAREAIEAATDRGMAPAVHALGDDLDALLGVLRPWGETIRATGAYVGGPVDLWPDRDD